MARAYLQNDEPIGLYDGAEQGWSDTYIRLKERPNGTVYYGPTYISKSSLLNDIETDIGARQSLSRDGKTKEAASLDFDIAEQQAVLQCLESEPVVIVENKKDPGVPTIYTAAEKLNRAEIEKMTWAWLNHKGHKVGSLKWERNKSRHVVTPWG